MAAKFDEHLATLQSDYKFVLKEMKREAVRYREFEKAIAPKPLN
jgi:hypothetical protein